MTVAIQIENLEKTYSNGFRALKGISLQVKEGDFFALLGPNGAGKSTTIGIISTLVNKSAGRVAVFGRNVDSHVYQTKMDLGVVPQEVNFSQFERVEDILVTQAGYYGLPRKDASQRAQQYLEKLGLWDKRQVRARELSGGMKRRLMIARALMHEPRLLILDEPTAGVDIELRRSMWEFLTEINEQGTTIILTTHYLEEAEQLCRNIAIIDQGEIVENTSMKTLLAELDSQTYIFDISARTEEIAALGVEGIELQQVDNHTLEVTISGTATVNQVFAQLSLQHVVVNSMRNKTNRLEQLFLAKLQQ